MKRYDLRAWAGLKRLGASLIRFLRAFEATPPAQESAEQARGFAKAVLELIRNLAVVSAVKFFATKAESMVLHAVAEVGMAAIGLTVGTYITRFKFTGWDYVRSRRWRATLAFVYTIVPWILAYAILGALTNYIVEEIVRSQLLH
jgi:hypothetical protein